MNQLYTSNVNRLCKIICSVVAAKRDVELYTGSGLIRDLLDICDFGH